MKSSLFLKNNLHPMKVYKPTPIDLSNIELPAELESLAELMAKNVHDVWAQSRIKEGWTYGEHRSDTTKQHPGLVEYEELSEEEREYDRNTALSTLKLIIKLGFRITNDE